MGMRHRSIGLRVGILIAVPVLSLVLLYAFVASLTLSNALTQTRSTEVGNDLGTPIGLFQLQVAAERGLAVLDLASQSKQIAGELARQEAATTKSLAQLQATFNTPRVTASASSAELAAMRTVLGQSAELTRIRSAVAGGKIGLRTAVANYDSIIASAYVVLDRVLYAEPDVQSVTQALDLVNLDRARQATLAEGDLLAGDMAKRKFPAADRMMIASLAATRQQLVGSSLADMQPSYRAPIDRYVTAPVRNATVAADATVANTPWHFGAAPRTVVSARAALTSYATSLEPALLADEGLIEQASQRQGNAVLLQLILAGGLGLLALIATVVLSLTLGRGLVRQLRELRESALTVAHRTLPRIVGQLRSGQHVNPDEYAPVEFPTRSEIEQVGQAVSVLQHEAVQSAADEARLRRGINDVFRNLAGRSQSLLHRQLTLIDAMERRATDPDELENLFRIDHLTTRMRRHAEGLIILSGDTPARGWRRPVPLVDVLRAAVAEVEDYTRVRVLCRATGAVAGHAVADIVHLLAELAENATVFSPPNTPVRMQGDTVGHGFVIEIEDRGLGISRARLEEINAKLADPPQFDLSGSDRLGLFIAGQLARRHDVTVALRPSVYGGTTAIVHLPAALVAGEDAIVPDRVLPAGHQDAFRLGRASGRHSALTAISAGNGHGGGFNFGRVAKDDAEAEGTGRMDAAAGESLEPATAVGGDPAGESALSEVPPEAAAPMAAEVTELGLPIRVRQASLAPQLRDTPPAGAAEPGPALPRRGEPAAPASPEAARNIVGALQRGWQRGRAEPLAETAAPAIEEADSNAGDDDEAEQPG